MLILNAQSRCRRRNIIENTSDINAYSGVRRRPAQPPMRPATEYRQTARPFPLLLHHLPLTIRLVDIGRDGLAMLIFRPPMSPPPPRP